MNIYLHHIQVAKISQLCVLNKVLKLLVVHLGCHLDSRLVGYKTNKQTQQMPQNAEKAMQQTHKQGNAKTNNQSNKNNCTKQTDRQAIVYKRINEQYIKKHVFYSMKR